MTPSKNNPTEREIKGLEDKVKQLESLMLQLIDRRQSQEQQQQQHQPKLTQQIQEVREMRLQTLKELDRLTRIAGVMRQYH